MSEEIPLTSLNISREEVEDAPRGAVTRAEALRDVGVASRASVAAALVNTSRTAPMTWGWQRRE